jgi:hypothetical protein
MIKFFTKIRYNLINKGKTAKYFKYAIGEVALVMIGILLALQVNNWNEGRLEFIEEQKLLENIKGDFQEAIKELKIKNEQRSWQTMSNYALSDVMLSKDYSNKRYIDSLFGRLMGTPTYNSKSGSLTVLFNTGKINLIKNDSLKGLLFLWPQIIEDMTEGEISTVQYKNQVFSPLLNKYVNWKDIYRAFKFEGKKMKNRPSVIKANYNGLFLDSDFENSLYYMEELYSGTTNEAEEVIEYAEKIIITIDEELNIN